MITQQWLYQSRYVALTKNPPNFSGKKGNRGIYLTQQCLLCISAALCGSHPPYDGSPLHLCCQDTLSESSWQGKRERDLNTVTLCSFCSQISQVNVYGHTYLQGGEQVQSSSQMPRRKETDTLKQWEHLPQQPGRSTGAGGGASRGT